MMWWSKKEENNLGLMGLVQALGVSVYCGLVGMLIWRGNDLFGKMHRFVGPVMFLILFIVSALVCSLMVFYKPYVYFLEKRRKEAMDLVVWTTGWLGTFLLLVMIWAMLVR